MTKLLWSLSHVRVTTEGHLRFEVMGKHVQLGHVCHPRDADLWLGVLWKDELQAALSPHAKGSVLVDTPEVREAYAAEMATYREYVNRECPGFFDRYPMPQEVGDPVLFGVSGVMFRASRTVGGGPCVHICGRLDRSEQHVMLHADGDGQVTEQTLRPILLDVPTSGPHVLETDGGDT